MPSFNLATLARRQRRIRRRYAILRPVTAPQMLATDLYRSCYLPIVQHWQRAAETIIAEYARALSEMTTDSPADLQGRIDDAERAANAVYLTITPSLRSWVLRVESHIRTRWRGAVLAATNVDLGTLLGPADVRDTLEAYIGWNVDLIKDVSAQAKKRIADRVFAGLTQRKPAREVAKEIREAVGMARDRSVRIASDQLNKISTSLAEERQREAGIEQVVWVHSAKKHPRETHKARDGKRYYLETKKAVDGSETVEAGDWVGQPPYCGCHSRAWIDLMDD